MMRRALAPAIADPDAPLRVWDVLTVDVVDGRIQTVRTSGTRTSSHTSNGGQLP